MKVQLVYFEGCPNVDLARRVVGEATEGFEAVEVEEIDVHGDDTPASLRRWGSPTILVNGRDVANESPAPGCCRIYADHHPKSRGAPSVALVRIALARAARE